MSVTSLCAFLVQFKQTYLLTADFGRLASNITIKSPWKEADKLARRQENLNHRIESTSKVLKQMRYLQLLLLKINKLIIPIQVNN